MITKRKFKSKKEEIRFLTKKLVELCMGGWKSYSPKANQIRERLRELEGGYCPVCGGDEFVSDGPCPACVKNQYGSHMGYVNTYTKT